MSRAAPQGATDRPRRADGTADKVRVRRRAGVQLELVGVMRAWRISDVLQNSRQVVTDQAGLELYNGSSWSEPHQSHPQSPPVQSDSPQLRNMKVRICQSNTHTRKVSET